MIDRVSTILASMHKVLSLTDAPLARIILLAGCYRFSSSMSICDVPISTRASTRRYECARVDQHRITESCCPSRIRSTPRAINFVNIAITSCIFHFMRINICQYWQFIDELVHTLHWTSCWNSFATGPFRFCLHWKHCEVCEHHECCDNCEHRDKCEHCVLWTLLSLWTLWSFW